MATTTSEDVSARNAETEALLDECNVDWSFDPELQLNRIDRAKSLQNQARLEPINQEVVDVYAADVDRGDTFPAIIVLDPGGRAKLRVLGGNHRFAAYTVAGRKTIPAYVVRAEPEVALRITYEDNRKHGLQPSLFEKILQAIHLIDTGWNIRDAAKAVGVPEPRISTERSMVKAGRRAKDLGINSERFNALPKHSRYALGQIRSDPVFEEAVKLTFDARLSVDEVKRLAVRLREARSDNDAMQIIGLERESLQSRIQKTGGGKVSRKRTARAIVIVSMKEIRQAAASAILASTPTPESKAQLRKEVDATIEHLQAVRTALR
jgi:uncharacterized ParB-like nuclease family protein